MGPAVDTAGNLDQDNQRDHRVAAASMGPAVDTAGNLANETPSVESRSGRLQWGQRLIPLETDAPAQRDQSDLAASMGPAVDTAGNVWPTAISQSVVASMGPAVDTAGNFRGRVDLSIRRQGFNGASG